MKLLSFLLLVALFTGCRTNTETGIVGEWSMYKVIQDGKDVISEHDPYGERYLIIREDSTFESGGRPYGKNTGRYVYNFMDNTLFLDSDAGSDDDSKWKVRVKSDTMFWQGYGSEWAEGFELIQLRKRLN